METPLAQLLERNEDRVRAVLNLLDFIDGTIDPGYTVNPEVLGRNAT